MAYQNKSSWKKNYNNYNTTTYTAKVETKAVDTQIAPAAADFTGGLVFLVNGLVQGTSSFTRVGIQVDPKAIRIRGSMAPAGLTNFPGPYIRMALVYDESPQAALPSYEDIFLSYQADGTSFTSGSSSPNVSGLIRFTVVRDINMQLGYVSNQNGIVYATSPAQTSFETYAKAWNSQKKMKFPVRYKNKSNSGTVTDLATGAFYVVLYNSAPAGTIQTNLSVRFSYTDQ